MPSVDLRTEHGELLSIVTTEAPADVVDEVIRRIAPLGPTITATPSCAQFAVGSIADRTDFNDVELGALASLIAGQLAQAGHEAIAIARPSIQGVATIEPVTFTQIASADSSYALGMANGGLIRQPLGLEGEPTTTNEFHLQGQHNQKDHGNRSGAPGGGIRGAIRRFMRPGQRSPRQAAKDARARASKSQNKITATESDLARKRTADLYGAGFKAMDVGSDIEPVDTLFKGSTVTVVPFKSASRTKAEPLFDRELVNETLARPAILTEVDPRALVATQRSVTRDGVNYYLSADNRRTGRTYADQDQLGNRYPVVYRTPSKEWAILSGHHRATAALLQGRTLDAIVIDPRRPDPRRFINLDISGGRDVKTYPWTGPGMPMDYATTTTVTGDYIAWNGDDLTMTNVSSTSVG